MAVTRQKKAGILDVLKDRFARQQGVVILSFRGTSVKDVNALRTALFAEGLDYQVAKKNLVRMAAKEAAGVDIPEDTFNGLPFGVVFGYSDQVCACKIAEQFLKKVKTLDVLGGVIGGQLVTKEVVLQYAKLPSREVLLGQFVGMLKAPLSKFSGMLNSGLSGFARALSAYADKNA